MKNAQPKIQELKERQVAFVSFTGNYMGDPKIFENLFNKLCGWAAPKGLISAESVFLSSYQDDPEVVPPEEMKLDFCMSISNNVEVDGDIKKKTLPGGKYVVMNAELNSPEEYGQAWGVAVEWLKKNNLEMDMSRPSYEMYLNNPEEHPEKHHIIEICVSAK